MIEHAATRRTRERTDRRRVPGWYTVAVPGLLAVLVLIIELARRTA